jgi:hypothetical protein
MASFHSRPQRTSTAVSAVPRIMERLNDDYDSLVLALRKEKEAQDREIAQAWAEIDRERDLIRDEWRQIEEEKARILLNPRDAAHTAGLNRSAAASPPRPHHEFSTASQPIQRMRSGATVGGLLEHAVSTRDDLPSPERFTRGSARAPAPERRHYERGAHALQSTPEFEAAWHGDVASLSSTTHDSHSAPGNNTIIVWSGVARGGSPRRLVLPHFRTMGQLLERAAAETGTMPAGGHLYTPDGRVVDRLEDVEPGQDYLVLPSGCRYREDSVPTQLLRKLVTAAPSVHHATILGE